MPYATARPQGVLLAVEGVFLLEKASAALGGRRFFYEQKEALQRLNNYCLSMNLYQ
jgi:hypothetical protein